MFVNGLRIFKKYLTKASIFPCNDKVLQFPQNYFKIAQY